MTKKFYVYTHTRQDNRAVFYIGCATWQGKRRGDISKYQRAYDVGQRTHAWFDVARYGVIVEIVLETESRAEAFNKERELIAIYGRLDIGTGQLVNQTDGGPGCDGQVGSDKSRELKSLGKRGEKNPYFGKVTPISRQVKNVRTGVVYESISRAAKAEGIAAGKLYSIFDGHTKENSTDLVVI